MRRFYALVVRHGAEGMRIPDRWVVDGCDPASPAIEEERVALVRGYTALRAAVTSGASS
jgi:hypothetical protein